MAPKKPVVAFPPRKLNPPPPALEAPDAPDAPSASEGASSPAPSPSPPASAARARAPARPEPPLPRQPLAPPSSAALPSGRAVMQLKDGRRVRRTTMLLGEELARRLDVFAASRGVDKAVVVNAALEKWLSENGG